MRISVLLAAMFLVACGKPEFDGSSDEKAAKSMEKVRASVEGEKAAKLSEALSAISSDAMSDKDGRLAISDASAMKAKVHASINGKDADGIIAEGARVLAERESRKRQQALAEVVELETKQKASDEAKAHLAKFKINRSRFQLVPQQYGRSEPVIEIDVENGTSVAISRAYFKGRIESPGRSIPWLVQDFNYKIPGGLEPGEKASWSLNPNIFSEWGKTEAPPDAVFTVETVKLDGADDKAAFDANGFSDRDAKRLEDLKKSLL